MTLDPKAVALLREIAERDQEASMTDVNTQDPILVDPTPEPVPAPEPTPEPTPAPAKQTNYAVYLVTAKDDDQILTMTYGGSTEAPNDIKAVTDVGGANGAGQYVAIPVRSLRVRTVEVVNQPKVVVS
jgi:hypothetical protein